MPCVCIYIHTYVRARMRAHTHGNRPSILLRAMYMKMSHMDETVTKGGFFAM